MGLTTKNAGSLVPSVAGKDRGDFVKIKILRNTVCNGKPVFIGDELEVSGLTGRLLINLGKAEDIRLSPPPAAAPVVEVKKETSRDVDETSKDPDPASIEKTDAAPKKAKK